MINNPFTSDFFTTIWSKHFNTSAEGVRFGFVGNLLFKKHDLLPLYTNFGKTLTKGISYSIIDSTTQDLGSKVLLIYDVPTFFNVPEPNFKHIKKYRIKQYPGFLVDIEEFDDVNSFLLGTFKKSSRYKLKKYKNKLETCFDINYKMFSGDISKEEYDLVFKCFKNLLNKRFDDKQITNNNLNKEEWDFYYEVAYSMILDKKAGLFVIYNGTQPIGITLVYFSEEILFDAITVFDIDYAKFHLGSVTIMKLMAWSIEHKLKIFDFSKGYFDYKKRWATREYDFEYHILYNSKSLWSSLLAILIKNYFVTKQLLRDKKINEKIHQLTFRLRKKNNIKKTKLTYDFFEIEKDYQNKDLVEIDLTLKEYNFLKTIVFDFLYLNNENYNDLRAQKIQDDDSTFLFYGKIKNKLIKIG